MKKQKTTLTSLAVMTVLLLVAACSSPSGSDSKPIASISNLAAARTGMTEVALVWDSVAGAVLYEISNEGGAVTINDDTTSTSFTVTGLNRNTEYTFVVDAINDEGSVIATGKIAVTTASLSYPDNITVSCDSDANTVEISWDAISSYDNDYEIHRSDTIDGEYALVGTVRSNATSFTDTNIADGSIHYYKIAVLKDDGSVLAISDPVLAQMGTDTTPDNLAVVMTPTRAILTWDAVEGAQSYIVEVYTKGRYIYSSDTLESTVDVSADKTTYTVTGLKPSTEMIFKLYSMAPTKSVPAEVTGKTEKLEVSAINQSACTASSISFNWTTSTSDPAADGIVFDVYRNSAWSYSNKGDLIAADQTVTSYVDTSSALKTGTYYYYSVVPKISGSTTTYTGVTNTKLHTTPFNAPANVTIVPGRTSLSVFWDDVPEAAINSTSDNHYKVSYAPHGSSDFRSVTSKTTSRVITGLSSSTAYDVIVCVANSGTPKIAGSDSAIVQSTTKEPLAAMSNITLTEVAATEADKTNITVTWTTVPEAGSYKVYYRLFTGGSYTLAYTTSSPNETSTTVLLNAGNTYKFYVKAIAADDDSSTSSSGVNVINSADIPETAILGDPNVIVKTGTTEIMDLNDADTWTSRMIPRTTDNGYNIGILTLNGTTTEKSFYFKMTMTSAMLTGAPRFIMMDAGSKCNDGNGSQISFGSDAKIFAVAPNDLSATTQISWSDVDYFTAPKFAGAPITDSMVYNNTLYLRLDTKATTFGDGSVGVSAYY